MKKFILAILLTVASTVVISATVSLQTATQREDNTPLGLSEIQGHPMYCYTDTLATNYSFEKRFVGAALPSTDVIIDTAPAGTFYCFFTTMDIDGRESKISANYLTLINEAKASPKPPTITPAIIKITTTLP